MVCLVRLEMPLNLNGASIVVPVPSTVEPLNPPDHGALVPELHRLLVGSKAFHELLNSRGARVEAHFLDHTLVALSPEMRLKLEGHQAFRVVYLYSCEALCFALGQYPAHVVLKQVCTFVKFQKFTQFDGGMHSGVLLDDDCSVGTPYVGG